jgi:hypothetical protein
LAIALPTPADAVADVRKRLRSGDVALEVLWPGRPTVFVGARFETVESMPLHALIARDDWTPSVALDALVAGVLRGPFRAELGAMNAWRSVGPLAVGINASRAAVEEALAGHPRLAWCRDPVALEVVCDGDREAWWGVEVSLRTSAGLHRVDAARVAELLRSIAA